MRSSPSLSVEQLIFTIRGRRVILSPDLARIYGVAPRVLNQAVKRHPERFPADFAFRLSKLEAASWHRLRSQSVILKRGTHIKYPPLAFTEHGAVMAATVLNSPRAVQMSIFVVRAFLKLREWVSGRSELWARLTHLERKVGEHDHELKAIIEAVRQLLRPPEPPAKRRAGSAPARRFAGSGPTMLPRLTAATPPR